MRPILTLLIVSLPLVATGQSVHFYKSVHADGTVSYSDTRPRSADSGTSVTTVNVPRTDDAIVNQGKQRKEEMRAIATDLEKQRAEQSQARRKREKEVAQARREIADAERNLATTRQSKHNATEERIALAERRLELARQKLRELQRAGP